MRTHLAFALLTAAAIAAVSVVATAPRALSEGAAAVAGVDVPTARGVALKANLHKPAKSNGTVVVLAPGQGYHRELPLMKRSAEALADAGFTALRFDWAYFTAKGQPSEGFATEIADVDGAIAFAKKESGAAKVLLAGKSLGSFVAAQWASAHAADLAGVALLTLPLHDQDAPDRPDERAAVAKTLPFEALIICGDSDPIASRPSIYKFAAEMTKPPRLVIVPGDHGFQPASKNEAEKLENVELAVRALVVWAKREAAK